MTSFSSCIRCLPLLALSLPIEGCGRDASGPSGGVGVVAVNVSPASFIVVPSGRVLLTALPQDSAGRTVQTLVTWTSSDPAVATVAGGMVTGVAAGSVTVRATAGGVVGEAVIEVVAVRFTSLSVGGVQACGLTSDGRGFCWGHNESGQLGDGTTSDRSAPVGVAGGLVLANLDAGNWQTCGVSTSGAGYCWGAGMYGALGDGTRDDRPLPGPVSGDLVLSEVRAAFSSVACGLTRAGEPWCWGYNGSGALGQGSFGGFSSRPVAVSGGLTLRSLTAGGEHFCGLTASGEAWCWGSNSYNQLGDSLDNGTPVRAGSMTFVAVTAGLMHTCGLQSGGTAWCWGQNAFGELGNGSVSRDEAVPTRVAGNLTFVALSSGGNHTCGLTAQGWAYCWGMNNYGQVGNGTVADNVPAPSPVSGGHVFAQIAVGGNQTCGITTAGVAYCWGDNFAGQLGNGSRGGMRSTPMRVQGQP